MLDVSYLGLKPRNILFWLLFNFKGHSRRSVDAIIDAYNQIPDKTKLFLERKTSELIRQGANVTVEDFAKATKDIIDDLILRL